MKIKFANGTIKECTAPTEQKMFKTTNGGVVSVGWMLMLKLIGVITATELDNLLTADNVASLEFLTENENGEDKTLFKLDNYSAVTSSAIRYSEDITATYTEIQLTKVV